MMSVEAVWEKRPHMIGRTIVGGGRANRNAGPLGSDHSSFTHPSPGTGKDGQEDGPSLWHEQGATAWACESVQ